MDRRKILRMGLATGATLVIERLGDAPAAAATKAVVFYSTVNVSLNGSGIVDPGGPLAGYQILLAVTGQSARGTMINPTSANGTQWIGYRLRGSISGKSLSLNLYDLSDLSFSTPVGTIVAALKKKVYSGDLTLNGAPAGSVTLTPVPLNASKGHPVVGKYWLYVSNQGSYFPLGGGLFTFSANNTFSGSQVESDLNNTSVPSTVAGRWGAAYDAKDKITLIMTVSLLPDLTGVQLNGNVIPSEVHVVKLVKKQGEPLARPASEGPVEPHFDAGLLDFLQSICGCFCFCSPD